MFRGLRLTLEPLVFASWEFTVTGLVYAWKVYLHETFHFSYDYICNLA